MSQHTLTIQQSNNSAINYWLFPLAVTLILVGYLQVWLPHPAAGLTQVGYELGEWVKFIPEIRFGEATFSRNWLYLPPITLGSSLVLWTVGRDGWQAWFMRGLGCLVALLAMPPLGVILNEDSAEWRLRLSWIALVAFVALITPLLAEIPPRTVFIVLMVLALVGGIVPTVVYLSFRPIISNLLGSPVGIGIGVWLNLAGHIMLALSSLVVLKGQR